MRYRVFGKHTGLRVAQLALGTGNFGAARGYGAEPAEARRMFGRYIDATDWIITGPALKGL